MSRRWRPPSAGLLFLCGSWLALGVFLAWGSARPNLDRVQDTIVRVRRPDADVLSSSELELLRQTMKRQPGLALALAGKDRLGWVEAFESSWCTVPRAHYILHGEPDRRSVFWVDARAYERAYPLVVTLNGDGFSKSLRFAADGKQSFELAPGQLIQPIIAEVSVTASIPAGPDAHPFQVAISSGNPAVAQRLP